MGIVICGVQPEEMQKVLPSVAWHFGSFEERSAGRATASDLVTDVIERRRQCWLAVDGKVKACALTQVIDGHRKVVEWTHCAGEDRELWQDAMAAEIYNWGKSIGATRFAAICRPGHSKFLRSIGMRETHRVMEQDIG